MRIGFDAKRAFVNKTGLGNYSRTLLSSLLNREEDSEVYLFSPTTKVSYIEFIKSTDRAQIVTPPPFLSKTFSSIWRTFCIANEIEKHGIDLYHGLSQELPIGINDEVAKVVTVHDVIFLRYKKNYNPIDIATYTRKTRYACEKADVIIAISEQTKRDIIEFFGISPEKITVIYQDCHSRFKKAVQENEVESIRKRYDLPSRFLLSVGALNYRKNNMNLIKALQYCDDDVHLCISGNGEQKKNLLKYVTQNNLSHRVHFLGYVPDRDLPALYKVADIFVYPSLFEGFGIPILESFHVGTPVMTGIKGCFSEVGGSHAVYFDQTSPQSIGETIQKFWNNPSELKDKMKGVEEHLSRFDSSKVTDEVLQVYKKALADKGKDMTTNALSKNNTQKGISALIITKNEQDNIRGYLDTVSFADEIIVVDSFSTDKTVEIIQEYPYVKLLQRKFDNFSSQKNFAIAQANYDWILFIDTDERIDEELRKEILFTIHLSNAKSCYYFYRRFFFKDKVLNYSGWQRDKAIRLFKNKGIGYAKDKLVHEQIHEKEDVGFLKNKLDHYSFVSEEEYTKKLDLYARFRAEELLRTRTKASNLEVLVKSYYRYFKHYIWQLGFLDGKEGKIIAKLYKEYVQKRYRYFNEMIRKNESNQKTK